MGTGKRNRDEKERISDEKKTKERGGEMRERDRIEKER
jgi:hypothetical protein